SFSEDGIPAALLNTFLDSVVADVVAGEPSLAAVAFRVVSIAAENGLVHPIKCIPAICAMESNPNTEISQHALYIHQKLNEKHASFIHSKTMDSVRCVYEYQNNLAQRAKAPLRGFSQDSAFINPMYSLLRPLRSRRNAFLKSLVGLFDLAVDKAGSLAFLSFVADTLAYLDYKSLEEVLHVVFHINLLLSVSGEELRVIFDGYGETELPEAGLVFRAQTCGMLIQLRSFLQKRFGLGFQQCLDSGPAQNAQSAPEKAVTVCHASLLFWDTVTEPSKVIAWYLDISDECLGSGDVDYVESLLASAPPTPASPKANGDTPKRSASGAKKRGPKTGTPLASTK
ncbi:hypothetical protein HDU91_004230, partial [Kappamyces sp. JEL0680]